MSKRLSNWATVQVCADAGQPVTCPSSNSTPGNGYPAIGAFKGDPEIAGVGVCYAFVISAFLTLGVTALLFFLEVVDIITGKQKGWIMKGTKILQAVILSFSDQQIVTGLSLVIATRWYMGCSISAYHYDIVCNLVLMSVVTHLCSITFITPYFHRNVLGIARVFLILFTFAMAGAMLAKRSNTSFPTGKPNYAPTDSTPIPYLTSPAACFMSGSINTTSEATGTFVKLKGSIHASGSAEYIILLLFAIATIIVAAIYSIVNPERWPRLMWGFWVFRVVLLIAALGIAIAITHQFWPMRTWMSKSIWLADTAESDWTFGQFLPLLLMMLAGLAVIEAFYDHRKDPPETRRYLPGQRSGSDQTSSDSGSALPTKKLVSDIPPC